ncbi:PREDICTED: structural maintenance of chromosomes protein 1-like [Ceratosolen solmsi marchali]|uniref:Structural maintenance of chromosomes protein 1-like n=1 Tax=Ceratosolen solmsi marchali TaxID=326594 RepID=A0AAJ6YHT7_9HYME|nr:PREDICTED: structural maintenance of chromosomes protein 1-like [Ceratosolen solmsi marchali]
MQNLSGGEKTMSAVALLLAIYRVKPAPFIIFDEIDAALDNANINKIANHLLQLKSSMQIINISHHELLSSCADTIIGINISPRTNSTYVVHVKLGQYQKKTIISKCIKNTLKEKPQLLKARMENYSMVE